MKKIIAIILAASSLFFLTVTKTMAEWSAGISLSHGAYEAGGTESESGEINTAKAEEGAFTFPSIFVEKNMGRVSIGLDFIPGSVDTEEATRTDYNCTDNSCVGNDGTTTSVTNKASVSISQHVSIYAVVPITDIGAFVRLAVMRADVETTESLGTGSSYPDTTMRGSSVSLGYQHDLDGVFLRVEAGVSSYETIKVTSTGGNIVSADIDGEWGRISIGKSF